MIRSNNVEENKRRLLDEGVSMLVLHGYHGTGLKELLARVNIPKGSFYNYFDSKEVFCSEVISHYLQPFINQVDACLSISNITALDAIKNYFNILIDELETKNFSGGCLLGNLLGELADTNEVCLKQLTISISLYRDKLEQGFKKAQQEGAVRNDITAQTMSNLMLNNWQGALLRMKTEKATEPLKECCEHLLNGYFLK